MLRLELASFIQISPLQNANPQNVKNHTMAVILSHGALEWFELLQYTIKTHVKAEIWGEDGDSQTHMMTYF